jgi:hypothetical protein
LKLTAEFGWCLAVSTFILAAWYMLSSWVVFFYARYFCPQLLGFTLFGAYVLLKIYQRHAGAIFSFLVIIAILVFFRISLLQVGRPRGDYDYRHTQLVLVKEVVPDKDYVAAGQSGTLGYFRDRVVNLDGKVNAESLRFQNNMQEYLKEKKVYWVCDFTKYIRRYLGDEPEKHGWQLVGSKNGFFLYHYQGNS